MTARIRRHPAHPADARAGAHRALRVPAVSGRPGRAGVAGGHARQGAVGQAARETLDGQNRVGDRRLHLERAAGAGRGRGSLATFPEEFRQGMVARAEMLGDTGRQSSRPLGGRPGQPGPARDRHPLRARCGRARAMRGRARARRRRVSRAWRCSRRSTSRPRRRSTTRTTTSATATGCRSRSSRARARADARLGRPAEGRRVHPRLPRRGRPTGPVAAARDPVAQRQLHGLPPAGGARRGVPRLPEAERADARGAGAGRGQAHGPLAERRAARRWRPNRTIPRSAADPQRNNDFNYKEVRTRTATPCRSARTSAA